MRKKQVRWLDVAMDKAECMRFAKRVARLEDVVERLVERQRPVAIEPALKIFARQVLHHDVWRSRSLVDTRIEHVDRVLTTNRPSRACLTHESGVRLGGCPFGQKKFDRDITIERTVTGGKNDSHPAPTKHTFEDVPIRDPLSELDVRPTHDTDSNTS
jgi:hypothetical protein